MRRLRISRSCSAELLLKSPQRPGCLSPCAVCPRACITPPPCDAERCGTGWVHALGSHGAACCERAVPMHALAAVHCKVVAFHVRLECARHVCRGVVGADLLVCDSVYGLCGHMLPRRSSIEVYICLACVRPWLRGREQRIVIRLSHIRHVPAAEPQLDVGLLAAPEDAAQTKTRRSGWTGAETHGPRSAGQRGAPAGR